MSRLPASVLALLVVLALTVGCSRESRDRGNAGDAYDPAVDPAPASALDSLFAVGEDAYWDGDFEIARTVWLSVLAGAEADGDKVVEAKTLTSLGLAAWRQGDFPEARQYGERALGRKLELGLDSLLFRSYNALGLLAWHEGRLVDATDRFEQASVAARAVGDEESLAKAGNNLGLVYTEMGDFPLARDAFLETIEAARAIDNQTIEASALSNLGMLDLRVGDPQTAIESLLQAREVFARIDNAFYEQNTLGQLGHAYKALGEPGRALAALDTALMRAREAGLRQEEASNLVLIADVYRDAGDLQRALEFLARARDLDEELGLAVELGSDLRGEAQIFAQLGDLERARSLAVRAAAIHEDAGALYETFIDELLLAELDERSGRPAKADERLFRARAIADNLATRSVRVSLAQHETRIADHRDQYERVLEIVDHVREDLQFAEYEVTAELEHLAARAHAALGEANRAAAAGERAIMALERVRGRLGSTILQTSLVAGEGAVYTEHVGVLLRLGDIDRAFEIADGARGRALLEHLASERSPRGEGVRSLARGEALLRKIDALVKNLNAIDALAPGERGPGEERTSEFLASALTEARTEYASLLMTASERDAAAVTLLGGRFGGAEAVRAALRPGEALLVYLSTGERVRLFLATRQRLQSLEYEISEGDLASRIRLARDLASTPTMNSDAPTAVLRGLYEALIGPAVRSGMLHDVERLIVVPHGALNYLPFGALIDPVTERYLAEQYELLFLPSASVLPVIRDTSGRAATNVRRERGFVFAPFPNRLPATAEEARAIDRALDRVTIHEGTDATEAALFEAFENRGVLHIATHAVMNSRNPLFSRVEMAPEDNHDGRVEIHELLTTRVRNSLVFLSGCETGVGAAWSTGFRRGEDYATLSKALLYAGATNVVATLWRIEDQGAAAFAERFYVHLESAPPARALALAQRDMIAEARWRAPYHWAAYQISGPG